MYPNRFLKNRSGIYGILCKPTGKVYVGRTNCFYNRAMQYRYEITNRRKRHCNPYLLAALAKYGASEFTMFVLEFCSETRSLTRETYWMRKLRSTDRRYGYNLRVDSLGGMKAHPETIRKIRRNLKAQWKAGIRKEHGAKMKRSWQNNPTRRTLQSEVMRRVLTKYLYQVYRESGVEEMTYAQLKRAGFRSVISAFFRSKSNEVVFKGVKVVRKVL